MLTHPILEQLTELRLIGMHKALGEQLDMNDLQTLSFDERRGGPGKSDSAISGFQA